MDLKYYVSPNTNPYWNLALEDAMMRDPCRDFSCLIFWRSQPSVVIGRFQNPWVECDLASIMRDKIELVRRLSGGGCVYHDLNNLNFGFIQAPDKALAEKNLKLFTSFFSFKKNLEIIQNERFDLLINNNKISGSAFKKTRHGHIHHGTLLFASDLDRIVAYLHHKSPELLGRNILSRRSPMTNISQHIPQYRPGDFINDFCSFYQLSELESDYVSKVEKSPYFHKTLASLKSYEWRWQETPKFCFEIQTPKNGAFIVEVEKCRVVNVTSKKNHFSLNPPDFYLYDKSVFDIYHPNNELIRYLDSISLVSS